MGVIRFVKFDLVRAVTLLLLTVAVVAMGSCGSGPSVAQSLPTPTASPSSAAVPTIAAAPTEEFTAAPTAVSPTAVPTEAPATPVPPTPTPPSLDPVAATDPSSYPPFFGDEGNTYWGEYLGDFHLCTKNMPPESRISLHLGPSRTAPVLAEVNESTCGIQPVGPWLDGWAPVIVDSRFTSLQDGSLVAGYVRSAFVRPGEEQAILPWLNPNLIDPQWCVIEDTTPIHVRIAPIDEAPSLLTIAGGECAIYPATEPDSTDEWVRVTVDFERQGAGWVRADQIVSTEQALDFGDEPLVPVRFAYQDKNGEFLEIEKFKVVTADGLLVGQPSTDGTLQMPASLDPLTVSLLGWSFDKYCVTSGSVRELVDDVYLAVAAFGGCV